MLRKTFFFLFLILQGLQAHVEEAGNVLVHYRTRTALINYLIEKNGYKSYLEIGVAGGENLRQIVIDEKTSVDPNPVCECTHHLTSDEFFAQNAKTFDIIFIDGLHHHEQVLNDVENSLACLNHGGTIVMHDCCPQAEHNQVRPLHNYACTGDVWKAAAHIRMTRDDLHFCVLDMDWGCGVITPHSSQTLYPYTPIEEMDWNFFVKNRDGLINLVSVEDWLND